MRDEPVFERQNLTRPLPRLFENSDTTGLSRVVLQFLPKQAAGTGCSGDHRL